VHVFVVHQKADGIAIRTATKAVIKLLGLAYAEGG